MSTSKERWRARQRGEDVPFRKRGVAITNFSREAQLARESGARSRARKRGEDVPKRRPGVPATPGSREAWYQRNREEVIRKVKEWSEQNPERVREIKRASHERNKDKPEFAQRRRIWSREYQARNHESINARNRDRYAHDPALREERNQAKREWHQRNKEYARHYAVRQRAKILDIPAPRNNTRWTEQEDAIVMREDLSSIELAYMLGRSVEAIRQRRRFA